MFDINRRKQFETVGELRKLIKDIPSETKIAIIGDDCCWFHIEEDGSVICLDTESLDDCYDEDDEYCPSSTNGDYSPSNPWDAPGMSIRDFI